MAHILLQAAGRLLYCGQDDWVHVNCALWSAEVYEDTDGSLQNLKEAYSRGKMLVCTGFIRNREMSGNFLFFQAQGIVREFHDVSGIFCSSHTANDSICDIREMSGNFALPIQYEP